MEEKTVDFKKVKRQMKINEFKQRCKEKLADVATWCANNKEIAIIGITSIAGAIGFGAKAAIKRNNTREAERVKENYIYDRRHGHYIKMRRAPKQSEWSEIDRRKDHGENLSQILQDLRLL